MTFTPGGDFVIRRPVLRFVISLGFRFFDYMCGWALYRFIDFATRYLEKLRTQYFFRTTS